MSTAKTPLKKEDIQGLLADRYQDFGLTPSKKAAEKYELQLTLQASMDEI